jgi:hypothetical protein
MNAKKLRRIPYWILGKTQAGLGPMLNWQEWFGGYYWLRIELWIFLWGIALEITNRPPDPDEI